MREVVPSVNGVISLSVLAKLVPVDGRVVFASYTPGPRVFASASDGTVGGTVLLEQLPFGSSTNDLSTVVALNASTAVYVSGGALKATDGTPAGTRGLPASFYPASPTPFVFGGKAYAYLQRDGGRSLIQTDGTAAGTRPIHFLRAPARPPSLHRFDQDRLVLPSGDGNGHAGWVAYDTSLPTGTIHGKAWRDLNRDVRRQDFEVAQPGRFFIDLNENDAYDDGELNVVGRAFDFDGLVPGRYKIGFIPDQPAWTYSTAADVIDLNGDDVTVEFVAAPSSPVVWGRVFEDANRNGLRDPDESNGARQQLYLDLDGNGVWSGTAAEPTTFSSSGDGTYGFADVPVGTISVRRIDAPGFIQTNPADRGARQGTAVANASVQVGDFGVAAMPGGTIRGVIWADQNRNGILDGADVPLTHHGAYLDYNRDGVHQATEPGITPDFNGIYTIQNVPAEQYAINARPNPSFGAYTTTPAGGSLVRVVSGGVVTFGDLLVTFAAAPSVPAGSISGRLWVDRDADGVRDAEEPAASGVVVFLDTNNNGLLDATERRDRTTAAGAYAFPYVGAGTHRVRAVAPAGWTPTSAAFPATTTVGSAAVVVADVGYSSPDGDVPFIERWTFDADRRAFSVLFNEDVTATLGLEDFTLLRADGSVLSLPAGTALFATPGGLGAELRLNGTLPPGLYRLAVNPGGVADAAGNLLVATSLEFAPLAGDADGNGSVGFTDLLILAKRYGLAGQSFGQGNLDYSSDGAVNFDDLLILAQRYGSTLTRLELSPTQVVAAPGVKRGRTPAIAGVLR